MKPAPARDHNERLFAYITRAEYYTYIMCVHCVTSSVTFDRIKRSCKCLKCIWNNAERFAVGSWRDIVGVAESSPGKNVKYSRPPYNAIDWELVIGNRFIRSEKFIWIWGIEDFYGSARIIWKYLVLCQKKIVFMNSFKTLIFTKCIHFYAQVTNF